MKKLKNKKVSHRVTEAVDRLLHKVNEDPKAWSRSSLDVLLQHMTYDSLLPCQLSKRQVTLLKNEFGENWMNLLGYDDTYKKPKAEKE